MLDIILELLCAFALTIEFFYKSFDSLAYSIEIPPERKYPKSTNNCFVETGESIESFHYKI